jgi:hypothetical protein
MDWRARISTVFGFGVVLAATVFLAQPVPAPAAGPSASGIVASIVKAPISPDGDVAGATTDFVINLAADMDPAAPGRVLQMGESIRIQLPDGFIYADPENFPVRDLFAAPDCKAGLIKCSTGVLLHGWPQHPILPTFPPGKDAQFSLSYDADSNSMIYTAAKDTGDAKFAGPGIKQIHLLLFGFRNPDQPGSYPIRVGIFDASDVEVEAGVGYLTIRPDPAPSINITSVFVPDDVKGGVKGGKPPNPNTIYQTAKTGQVSPMPWDFLIWDTNGNAYESVEIVQENDGGGRLVHSGQLIGRFSISSPKGATGQSVSGGPSVGLPGTPVIGATFGAPVPAGRLTALFTAGSQPGRYFTTFQLYGGNSATMVVDVVEGD